MNAVEKRSAVQCNYSPIVPGARGRTKLEHIHVERRAVGECNHFESERNRGAKCLSQDGKGIAQRMPRSLIVAVAPEESGQPVARHRPPREREVGEQNKLTSQRTE